MQDVRNSADTFLKKLGKSQCFSDWVCTAVMSNDVLKDLRGDRRSKTAKIFQNVISQCFADNCHNAI